MKTFLLTWLIFAFTLCEIQFPYLGKEWVHFLPDYIQGPNRNQITSYISSPFAQALVKGTSKLKDFGKNFPNFIASALVDFSLGLQSPALKRDQNDLQSMLISMNSFIEAKILAYKILIESNLNILSGKEEYKNLDIKEAISFLTSFSVEINGLFLFGSGKARKAVLFQQGKLQTLIFRLTSVSSVSSESIYLLKEVIESSQEIEARSEFLESTDSEKLTQHLKPTILDLVRGDIILQTDQNLLKDFPVGLLVLAVNVFIQIISFEKENPFSLDVPEDIAKIYLFKSNPKKFAEFKGIAEKYTKDKILIRTINDFFSCNLEEMKQNSNFFDNIWNIFPCHVNVLEQNLNFANENIPQITLNFGYFRLHSHIRNMVHEYYKLKNKKEMIDTEDYRIPITLASIVVDSENEIREEKQTPDFEALKMSGVHNWFEISKGLELKLKESYFQDQMKQFISVENKGDENNKIIRID